MDFPKSVPGVGLVGGEFVNEDTTLGQQGSLIPAEWGNAVTKELVAVIEEDGQTPSESVLTQLRDALYGTVSSTKRRLLRIAASNEITNDDCDDAAVTPKKIRLGIAYSFGESGYFALPTWLLGLIFQWGKATSNASGSGVLASFPIEFPSACFFAGIGEVSSPGSSVEYVQIITSTKGEIMGATYTAVGAGTVGSLTFKYFALGR